METSVKPINKRTEVASSVFGEIERMVGAAQAGFEIAQNRVDPVKFRRIFGLATILRAVKFSVLNLAKNVVNKR